MHIYIPKTKSVAQNLVPNWRMDYIVDLNLSTTNIFAIRFMNINSYRKCDQ